MPGISLRAQLRRVWSQAPLLSQPGTEDGGVPGIVKMGSSECAQVAQAWHTPAGGSAPRRAQGQQGLRPGGSGYDLSQRQTDKSLR